MRGKLLHAVMHVIWGGPPRGIRTLDELRDIADRHAFVSSRVDEVMRNELPSAAREQMPPRYIELEARRLTRLVTEWLEYEAARLPFTVAGYAVRDKAGGVCLRWGGETSFYCVGSVVNNERPSWWWRP